VPDALKAGLVLAIECADAEIEDVLVGEGLDLVEEFVRVLHVVHRGPGVVYIAAAAVAASHLA
jgi:hypothetical protein